MPLKLSISLSRKVGEANYGSRGATVGLEMEADASLVHRPEEFNDQIAHLFWLARESVNRELTGQGGRTGNHSRNGVPVSHETTERPATINQTRAIHAIANRLETRSGRPATGSIWRRPPGRLVAAASQPAD